MMLTVRILALAALTGVFWIAPSSTSAPAALTPEYTVSTIAGAGTSGTRDGDARTAQFMKPIGIAVDAHDNIFVADAAAQRIREISPSGDVRTIGGSGAPEFNSMWVSGGYKDGPALQARFNRPSGVAVGPDNTVYVADTLNHCIRSIKNGMVSTYAGAPNDTAGADGVLAKASFIRPRALAFNAAGDLFVADDPIGVRKISAGMVTTMALPIQGDKRMLSIAFSGSMNENMIVGTAGELIVFDGAGNVVLRRTVTPNGGADELLYGMRGILNPNALVPEALGVPMGIAAYPDGHLVYADARSHALRCLAITPLACPAALGFANPPPDAADYGGGYRDGPLDQALFDEPFAVAKMTDGSLAVADTGNRRIRKVMLSGRTAQNAESGAPTFAKTDAPGAGEIVAGEDPFPGMSDRFYRIAYLGNSYAFYNTRWNGSIPGLIEAKLRSNWRALGFPKEPKLISISPFKGLDGIEEYIDDILSVGVVDAVIVQLNNTNIAESFPLPKTAVIDWKSYDATWEEPARESLARMKDTLKSAGIAMVVVANPTVGHVSPLEDAVTSEVYAFPDWIWLDLGPPAGNEFESDLQRVIARSGVSSIDLFPAFINAELDAQRVPLFGTVDGHYSPHGRTLAAAVIAKGLIRLHFWRPVH
jgi:hypothetical protein